MHPIVQKPISEPVIDRTGAVNYSACNNIDPLVSLDMVREMYDMQAKSLRTIIDEIYNSIAGINSGIEKFQSDIDRTNNSYTLFQRTVNAQIDNIKHTINNAQNQTTLQLTSFSDRIDYIEKECNSMRNAMLDHKQSIDDVIDTLNRNVTACRREVDKALEQYEDMCQSIRNVETANVSNEERINGILNHIIPNLSKEMEYHDGQIVKMVKNLETTTKATDDKITEQVTAAQTDISEFKADLNNETLRAQNAELKLQELIQGNATQGSDTNRQIIERLDDHDSAITRVDDRLTRETERSTGIEESLRNQIMSEAARATSEEASIKSDLKSITDLIGGKLDDAIGDIGGSMAAEAELRQRADDAIRAEYDDQLGKIHTKVEEIASTLTESIIDGDDREKRDRIDQDIALGNRIDGTDDKVNTLSTALYDAIDKNAATDANFNERLTKATADQLQTNGQNNSKFSEIFKEIRELNRRLDRFMEASNNSDEMIEEKIKRATATIITRIENLDNRIDSEIDRARKAERHLRRRLDNLEGIPVDDDSLSEDSDDKTDQGLMISDTDKEDN